MHLQQEEKRKLGCFSFFHVFTCCSKQSAAKHFGQMQITSLTPQPKSIRRRASVRRREETARLVKWKKINKILKNSSGENICRIGPSVPAREDASLRPKTKGNCCRWTTPLCSRTPLTQNLWEWDKMQAGAILLVKLTYFQCLHLLYPFLTV